MSETIVGSLENLRSKIKSIRFCMLTTVNDDLSLSSRPMTQQALDDDATLWFFTSNDSELVQNLLLHPKVNVSFAEPSDDVYVSITGDAGLVKDREKAEQLWNPMVSAWYPLGVNDPHLVLIKIQIHSAEYWDSHTNKMTHIFSIAKAVITGEQPKNVGEHEKLQF
jgi:general stress protein 26